ncbi:MAG: homoserine kinase [Rhodospirillaceae bacterium]|nr:homoserine kinase [Rhodospirillaceae bacterium]MBL6930011.1 homoserine kinase [Rhodospirillales bacterium]MBL6941493.1 homoserine kinase [Rhodospirillales bacterium]
MAVYTEVSDEELINFVAAYGIGEVTSCKGIAEGVENSNYLLGTQKGSYILTLYEKRVNPDDLPFFLGLMGHLAGKGIACPTPLEDDKGQTLGRLCGRHAAIITFLDGMWPRRITPDHCAGVGAAMARLHLAGADFAIKRANALSVDSWRSLLQASGGRADEVKPGLADLLARELDDLEAGWPDPASGLPAGVIHADLFPDNVFFKSGVLSGMIDFYFACNDVFAYDVAICLNAWCFETDGSFNVTKARRLLTAYSRERDFSDAELAALPLLARGSAMRFLLTRLFDWLNTPQDALVTPKDPLEYLEKLKFHQGVKGPGDYGL